MKMLLERSIKKNCKFYPFLKQRKENIKRIEKQKSHLGRLNGRKATFVVNGQQCGVDGNKLQSKKVFTQSVK